MPQDLKSMTKKQLEKLQKDVEKALETLRNKEMREARRAAEQAAQKFGYSLSELTDGKPRATRVKRKSSQPIGVAKYANPADRTQTWTGKGRQPKWFKEATAAGKDPKSMEL
ncbi:H-NS histone family protein [Roseobacter sinensis]|uniref:H-NS histone family protein n=1 Tax=Roseobacter sinensis TaxID=2931391 RepID=A0ABT3BGB4_9RHOB|nr:H-NS histone family protein [Roseobacter sp. WL0113]MCV3272213.1 H-NS histone family protein [Roseobacter sp. WL0113]